MGEREKDNKKILKPLDEAIQVVPTEELGFVASLRNNEVEEKDSTNTISFARETESLRKTGLLKLWPYSMRGEQDPKESALRAARGDGPPRQWPRGIPAAEDLSVLASLPPGAAAAAGARPPSAGGGGTPRTLDPLLLASRSAPLLAPPPPAAAPEAGGEEEEGGELSEEEGEDEVDGYVAALEAELGRVEAALRAAAGGGGGEGAAAAAAAAPAPGGRPGRGGATGIKTKKRSAPDKRRGRGPPNINREKLTECPNSCGDFVMTRDVAEHLAHYCSMRVVKCRMRGCNEEMAVRAVRRHLRRYCAAVRRAARLEGAGRAQLEWHQCARCPERVRLKDLGPHQEGGCAGRLVPCDAPGCRAVVPAGTLEDHKRSEECEWQRRTQELAAAAKAAAEAVECSGCHAAVPARGLARHMARACPRRRVPCPNAAQGCPRLLPAADVAEHLAEDCEVHKKREEHAEKYWGRRQVVECPSCGEMMELRFLAKHEKLECRNRVVPCRNWEFGCPVRVRLQERREHEDVNKLLEPRSCLYFRGGEGELVIREEGVKPPWTLEFWVYRPSGTQDAAVKTRAALVDYERYFAQKKIERNARDAIKALELELRDVARQEALEQPRLDGSLSRAGQRKEAITDALIRFGDIRDAATMECALAKHGFKSKIRAAARAIDELKSAGSTVLGINHLNHPPPYKLAADDELEEGKAPQTNADHTEEESGEHDRNDHYRRSLPGQRPLQGGGIAHNETKRTAAAHDERGQKSSPADEFPIIEDTETVSSLGQPSALLKSTISERKTMRSQKSVSFVEEEVTVDDREQTPAELFTANPPELLAQSLEPGALVHALFLGGPHWRPGQVVRARPGGAVDVAYDHGAREVAVPPRRVRADRGGGGGGGGGGPGVTVDGLAGATGAAAAGALAVGQPVEANFLRLGRWRPGRVAGAAHGPPGRVDVLYAHGAREVGLLVPRDVRPAAAAAAAAAAAGPAGLGRQESEAESEVGSAAAGTEGGGQDEEGEGDEKGGESSTSLALSSHTEEATHYMSSPGEWLAALQSSGDPFHHGRGDPLFNVEVIKLMDGQRLSEVVHDLAAAATKMDVEDERSSTRGGAASASKKSDASSTGGRSSKSREATMSAAARKKNRKKKAKKKAREEEHGARLSSKIRQATSTESPRSVLAHCAGWTLQLEAGGADRVGLVRAGEEDLDFGWRCPADRWVHLAFVASKDRKLTLFADGKREGQLEGVRCPLPLAGIGHPGLAPHMFLQELRVWAVQRTKAELQLWRSRLLPDDAQEHGLLGLWTLEEGEGRHAKDVTNQRYRTKMRGRGLIWALSERLGAAAPTPAWRERHVCRVELRRARLAQRGRAQFQLVACPRECGEWPMRKDVTFHLAHECVKRLLPCRQSAQGCTAEVEAWKLEAHLLSNECIVTKTRRELAEKSEEDSVPVPCPLDCGESLKALHLDKHLEKECINRLVQCMNPGCDVKVPAGRARAHAKLFCGSAHARARHRMAARARRRRGLPRPWALAAAAAAGTGAAAAAGGVERGGGGAGGGGGGGAAGPGAGAGAAEVSAKPPP